MEPHELKARKSLLLWYAKQTWFNRLLIRWLKLDDVYKGAYCDGWMDCEAEEGCSIHKLQDLMDAVDEIKMEAREVSMMISMD
jgi:hypothetical protein